MQKNIIKLWHKIQDDDSYEKIHYYLFKKNIGLIILLLLIASTNILLRMSLLPIYTTNDTLQYIETAKHFAGDKNAKIYGHRLLKPLEPEMMALMSPFFDHDYTVSLEMLSVLFYYALTVLIYFFLLVFLKKRKEAFIGSVLYITSYPMLRYNLGLYTETGALFFHLLGIYFATKYYLKPNIKLVIYSSLAITVGFLLKEYAALAGISLVIFILISKLPIKTKLAHLTTSALIALPILIGWQIHVYNTYHYSYLDWFKVGQSEPEETSQFTPFYISKSLFALLLLGCILVLGGVAKWKTFSKKRRTAGIVVGITSLGFLSWGYVSSRLYFVLTPILTVLAGRGTRWIKSETLQTLFILSIMFSTYLWLIVASMPSVRAFLMSY